MNRLGPPPSPTRGGGTARADKWLFALRSRNPSGSRDVMGRRGVAEGEILLFPVRVSPSATLIERVAEEA